MNGNLDILKIKFDSISEGVSELSVIKAEISFNGDKVGNVKYAELSSASVTIVDKDALKAMIDKAQEFLPNVIDGLKLNQFPTGTRDIYKAKIDSAIAVDNDANALKPEVDKMTQELKTLYTTMIKNSYNKASGIANSLYAADDKGLDLDKYPEKTKEKLKAVIDVTSAVYVDTALELEIWEQTLKLSPAVERYNAHKITANTGDFNNNGRFDIGDLTVIQYYYFENVTDESIEALRKADIDDNNTIGIEDLQFVAQRVIN